MDFRTRNSSEKRVIYLRISVDTAQYLLQQTATYIFTRHFYHYNFFYFSLIHLLHFSRAFSQVKGGIACTTYLKT